MTTATALQPYNPATAQAVLFLASLERRDLSISRAEIVRLNTLLDLACDKLSEATEENARLNRMLDLSCAALWDRTRELGEMKRGRGNLS